MKKAILWNTSGNIIYCFSQWLITILVVHLASFAQAGYLSLAMTTSSSFSAIALFKMRDFQISDVRGEFSASQYVGSRFFTCLLSLAVCLLYSLIRYDGYQFACIAAFMLIRVAEALVDVLHGIDQMHDRYDRIGISFFLRGFATIFFFVLALRWTGDLVATLFILAGVNLLIAVLYDYRLTVRLEKFRPVWEKQVRRLLRLCMPLVCSSFFTSLINLIAKEALQTVKGEELLGIYSSIASPTLVVQLFASVAFAPFLPKLSLMYEEKRFDAYLQMLKKIFFICIGFSFVVTAGAWLLGRWGLKILFGREILAYYACFMPIVWCTILLAVVWVLSSLVISLRQIWPIAACSAAAVVFCAVFAEPFVRRFGMNGASFVQIISYLVMIPILIWICLYKVKNEERKEKKNR